MSFILSLDGGATSLKAGVIDLSSKNIVYQIRINQPFNYNTILEGNQDSIIQQVIVNSPKVQIEHILVGLSGMDSKEETIYATNVITSSFNKIYSSANIKVYNDVELVLNNTDSKKKDKIAIISGTGSNCVGISEQGARSKSGGLGSILSDQGSGYEVGFLALKTAVESDDGRIKHSPITNKIYEKLGVSTALDLKKIVYNKNFSKRDFAKLALVVVELATHKDRLSIQILQQAGYELFKHVKAVANNLNFKENDFLVIESGSMFKVKEVREPFEELIGEYFPNAQIEAPTNPSFFGAVNIMNNSGQI